MYVSQQTPKCNRPKSTKKIVKKKTISTQNVCFNYKLCVPNLIATNLYAPVPQIIVK